MSGYVFFLKPSCWLNQLTLLLFPWQPDALDSNERRSWDCAKWAISVMVWWHVEAIMITILQLYSEFNYTISAVALKYAFFFAFFNLPPPKPNLPFLNSFGLHGMVVYLVTAFKSNQVSSDETFRR
mgnify:CR=1 FL=1